VTYTTQIRQASCTAATSPAKVKNYWGEGDSATACDSDSSKNGCQS